MTIQHPADDIEDGRIEADDLEFCLIHGYDHMKTDRGPIAYCTECDREHAHPAAAPAQGEPTPRMFAVAPELLAALQDLLDDCKEYARINNLHNSDGSPATHHSMRRAEAAIAKATGATP